jgi:cardiolipin synthase
MIWMSPILWSLLAINYVLAAIAIVKILTTPREPRAMLTWIFTVTVLPFIGIFAFVAIGTPRLERTKRRRRRRRMAIAFLLSRRSSLLQNTHAAHLDEQLDPTSRHLMKLATRVGAYPPTHSNLAEIYHDEEKSLLALRDGISSARSHVHLEYYIFKPDETGTMIRDVLIAKAREGVAVRVLVDYLGSWSLTKRFIAPMIQAGVKFDHFLPVSPWQGPWRINLRNHRKLLVIDGCHGFTGSHNIGNEYRGRHPTLGLWQDTNVKIHGPAVQQLQEVFVEDWFYTTGEELVDDQYFPEIQAAGPHVLQVIPSGPDIDTNPILDVVFSAITAAQSSICIMTPYFVPESALMVAMQTAAYRGVKVKLLVPAKNDNPLTLWAGRSFYGELMKAGIEVYEYNLGMLHNKVIVVDRRWSMVGSANMDHRSFHLNFELSTILYDCGLAEELLKDFDAFLSQSRRIGADGRVTSTLGEAIILGAARLVSPLL